MHHHGFLFQWQCAVFKKSDKSDNNQLGLCNLFQGRTKITINLCDDGMLQLPQFVSGVMHCCRWVSLYFIIQHCEPQFVSGQCTTAGGIFLFFNPAWQLGCVMSFFRMTAICQNIISIMCFDSIVHLWHQHCSCCNLFPAVCGGQFSFFSLTWLPLFLPG